LNIKIIFIFPEFQLLPLLTNTFIMTNKR